MQAQQPHATPRGRFLAMVTTYFLGVFNDNFFKQAGLLLAVTAGIGGLQGKATELFSLPFILFSAWAGWLADRFAKKKVIVCVKVLELAAMLLGAYGILTLNWTWVLAMLFVMGLQSTLFGPALNGSIPELFAPEQVTRANSILKLATTLAILLGMALAGPVLDLEILTSSVWLGRGVVAGIVVVVALGGLVAAFRVDSQPSAAARSSFPWAGPVASVRDLAALRRDPLLATAVVCDAAFYCFSLIIVLVINSLGLQQLTLGKTATSALSVSLMIGVCCGAWIASRVTRTDRWTHVLLPGAMGMGGCLLLCGALAQHGIAPLFLLFCLLILSGFWGGLFLIPVASFIQVRPDRHCRGRVIAAANFLAFCGMWFSGRIFSLLEQHANPASSMMLVGGFICMIAFGLLPVRRLAETAA